MKAQIKMTLDRVCARGLMLSFLLASCSVYAGYRECSLPQGEAIGTFPTEFFISQAIGNDSDWQIENFRKVPDSNWTQAWGDKTAKSIHSPPWKYRVDPSRDFQTAWVYATTSQGREHQAKFTCVQLSAISTADLCDKALVWVSGGVRWASTLKSRKPFIAEAKNRGLDCGVGTDTSALRSSAPESTSNGLTAAAIDDLCNRATTRVGDKLVWEPSKLFEKDVQEAKRRNLSCGVAQRGDSEMAQYEDKAICARAATTNGQASSDTRSWETDPQWSSFVEEAKRRNLSCGVEKVEVAKSEETSSQPKNNEIEKLLAANGALREEIESLVKANSALKEELQKANKQNGVSAADGKILRDKDLLIGSQASQIADLTKQIAENKPSLEAANQKISSQSDQINRLSAQIQEMQSNLDEADKKLQQLAQIFGGAASPGLVAPRRTTSSQPQSSETQSNQLERDLTKSNNPPLSRVDKTREQNKSSSSNTLVTNPLEGEIRYLKGLRKGETIYTKFADPKNGTIDPVLRSTIFLMLRHSKLLVQLQRYSRDEILQKQETRKQIEEIRDGFDKIDAFARDHSGFIGRSKKLKIPYIKSEYSGSEVTGSCVLFDGWKQKVDIHGANITPAHYVLKRPLCVSLYKVGDMTIPIYINFQEWVGANPLEENKMSDNYVFPSDLLTYHGTLNQILIRDDGDWRWFKGLVVNIKLNSPLVTRKEFVQHGNSIETYSILKL